MPDLPMPETPTVLIVDDNRPLADGFAQALHDEYETLTAYTAREARESLHEDVDVVLLDRRLPDTSGDRLLEEIRASGYDCRVAIVSAEEPTDGSDLDCDRYLTKPLSGVDAVRRAVSDLLDFDVSH
ncbi:response regulator [Halorussus gelatinilyticus]|uniref:Response regulator n=1 Tax=Halorussus gelatinilyticus TaxID=2937524 RepID=A0A8U0ILC4_9EURY|nr:response regulator [Halorussus gelatinilyticus]UPW01411.1 response regulator [Halorussus gelatinilyticus]